MGKKIAIYRKEMIMNNKRGITNRKSLSWNVLGTKRQEFRDFRITQNEGHIASNTVEYKPSRKHTTYKQ